MGKQEIRLVLKKRKVGGEEGGFSISETNPLYANDAKYHLICLIWQTHH